MRVVDHEAEIQKSIKINKIIYEPPRTISEGELKVCHAEYVKDGTVQVGSFFALTKESTKELGRIQLARIPMPLLLPRITLPATEECDFPTICRAVLDVERDESTDKPIYIQTLQPYSLENSNVPSVAITHIHFMLDRHSLLFEYMFEGKKEKATLMLDKQFDESCQWRLYKGREFVAAFNTTRWYFLLATLMLEEASNSRVPFLTEILRHVLIESFHWLI